MLLQTSQVFFLIQKLNRRLYTLYIFSQDQHDDSSSDGETIGKLCRQLSIESPGALFKDCVFNFIVPIPDTPATGARIKVVCAGACYQRNRSTSVSSVSSGCSIDQPFDAATSPTTVLPPSYQQQQHTSGSPSHHGIRNGSLFPGFEVAGVIEALGSEAATPHNADQFVVGQRVVLYPFQDTPAGYADYIVVPEIKYLIPIPDTLPLSVAAMLPTGALLAMNTVFQAHTIVTDMLRQRDDAGPNSKCKILIVGTGGLALWAVRIAAHYFAAAADAQQRVQITVASLRDEGLMLAKGENVNVVQWSEDLYEKQLIERTTDACDGSVDVVIDFCTTSRSLHRSLQCLTKVNTRVFI